MGKKKKTKGKSGASSGKGLEVWRDDSRRARAALEQFDYGAAEPLLEAAFKSSGGAMDAAVAWLEFLVDLMASDARALKAAARLSPEAAKHPRVRLLLACAAARLGDDEAAIHWVADLDGDQVRETYVTLAEGAIQAQQAPRARRLLTLARAAGSVTSRLLKMEDTLDALSERVFKPREQEIRTALERGDNDAAEQTARTLLEVWPNSEVARAALRELHERRRAERVGQLVREAEEALEQQLFLQAAYLFREALENGGPAADLQPRIRAAEADEARAQEQHRIDRVCERLVKDDPGPGTRAYCALRNAARTEVRERLEMDLLDWLEAKAVDGDPAFDPPMIDGFCALALVLAQGRRDDPEFVLKHLERHATALSGVDVAESMLARSHANLQAFREARARDALSGAQAALRDGEADQARAFLAAIDVRYLSEDERGQLRDLERKLDHREELQQLETALERAEKGGRWVRARDLLESLICMSEGALQEAWARRREAVAAEIRREWRFVAVTEGVGRVRTTDLDLWHGTNGRQVRLPIPISEEGQTCGRMTIATARGSSLFVRELELESGRVRRAAMMRTPQALGDISLELEPGAVWVLGQQGTVLELEADSWEVIRERRLAERLPPRNRVVKTLRVPGTPYIWFQAVSPRLEHTSFVLDLESGRQTHTPIARKVGLFLCPVGSSQVLLEAIDGAGVRAYAPDGLPRSDWGGTLEVAEDAEVVAALPAPEGAGVGLLYRKRARQGLFWMTMGPGGGSSECHVPGTSGMLEWVDGLTARVLGGLFLLLEGPNAGRRLLSFAVDEGGLRESWHAEVPRCSSLATGPDGGRVVLVRASEEGVEAQPLRLETPPAPTRARPWMNGHFPQPGGTVPQLTPSLEPRESVRDVVDACRELTRQARGDWTKERRQELREQPRSMFELAAAMHHLGEADLAKAVLEDVRLRHPDTPDIVLERAHLAAKRGDWQEVRRRLQNLDTERLRFYDPGHGLLLAGAAWYHKQRYEEAYQAWRSGVRDERGECDLEGLAALVAPRVERVQDDLVWQGPLVQGLRVAARLADQAIDTRDWARAVGILDHPAVWGARELHTFARFAEAALRLHPPDDVARFRQRLVMETYLEVFGSLEQDETSVNQLVMPADRWRRRRLADIARRARVAVGDG